MSEIDLDCCGTTEKTNPKKDLFRRKAKQVGHLFRLSNPIPEELKDSKGLKDIFKNWNLIPYAGKTAESGHSLLVWYLMLATLSPTNAAAISKKIKYAIGGKVKVVRSTDPEFETGEELQPVTVNESVMYRDTLKTFFEFDQGIVKFHRRIGWQNEATGNSFVEMVYAEVNGQGRISVRALKTTNCLFVNTKPGEARAVAISPVWEDKYLEKNPPRVVPVYPVFARDEDGNLRTMFQLKSGDNTHYGRPPSSGSDVYKYREVQDSIYLVKAAASDFTGKLIMEVEDDDPEFSGALENENAEKAGFDSFVDRFEQNFTNKGDDPQSVVVSSRPYGSRPMFVFQIAPNTKENWYAVTGKQNAETILRSHELTLRFMGFETSSGFSTDVYISDYLLNVEPVINELHDEITNFTNGIITAGWSLLGRDEMNVYSIAFTPPIQSSIEDFKNTRAEASTTARRITTPTTPEGPDNEDEDENENQNPNR